VLINTSFSNMQQCLSPQLKVGTCALTVAAYRRDAAEATRRRLDDAAKLKAQEEREKAAQKHQRQEYK